MVKNRIHSIVTVGNCTYETNRLTQKAACLSSAQSSDAGLPSESPGPKGLCPWGSPSPADTCHNPLEPRAREDAKVL